MHVIMPGIHLVGRQIGMLLVSQGQVCGQVYNEISGYFGRSLAKYIREVGSNVCFYGGSYLSKQLERYLDILAYLDMLLERCVAR